MSAYIDIDNHFHTGLSRDLAFSVLGRHLGTGTTRMIYSHASLDDVIVKIEGNAQSFCNITEYQVWEEFKGTSLARWFAPVLKISPSGMFLFMTKCTPVSIYELPKKVPAFMCDLKPENWGRLPNGKVVCLDYALNNLLNFGSMTNMKVAKWLTDKDLPA